MTWIKTVDEAEATGLVKEIYDHAMQRVGTDSVGEIVKCFSLKPGVLQAVENLRTAIKDGASRLGRKREEMIAVVCSALVRCTY
jgi:hypothetical protein